MHQKSFKTNGLTNKPIYTRTQANWLIMKLNRTQSSGKQIMSRVVLNKKRTFNTSVSVMLWTDNAEATTHLIIETEILIIIKKSAHAHELLRHQQHKDGLFILALLSISLLAEQVCISFCLKQM